MTEAQALQLLTAEVQRGSHVGEAIKIVLQAQETAAYRRSPSATDALQLMRLTGRAEGVSELLKLLTHSGTVAAAHNYTSGFGAPPGDF